MHAPIKEIEAFCAPPHVNQGEIKLAWLDNRFRVFKTLSVHYPPRVMYCNHAIHEVWWDITCVTQDNKFVQVDSSCLFDLDTSDPKTVAIALHKAMCPWEHGLDQTSEALHDESFREPVLSPVSIYLPEIDFEFHYSGSEGHWHWIIRLGKTRIAKTSTAFHYYEAIKDLFVQLSMETTETVNS